MGVPLHTARDTIVARATPPGVAALAVVRMSGPEAVAIASNVFDGADLEAAESHSASVGYLRADDGHSIDQVVVTVFRAPRSATGEDVVEISSHGGHLLPGRIVRVLERNGARPARAGEFTQRAFLNGKIDLAQAESIAELIHADAERAGDISVEHLKGRYSELLTGIREEILQATSLIELELDFSQEDVEFADRKRFEEMLMSARSILEELVNSYRFGRIARQGIRVVIAGRPNAGKSTLLNALLGYDRAIVSEQAGTTRDEIEAEVEVEGLRLLFVDTAGIRETEDTIEAEGVRRSLRAAADADAVLYLYDVTEGFHDEDRLILERAESRAPILYLANKVDLVPGVTQGVAGGVPPQNDPNVEAAGPDAAADGSDAATADGSADLTDAATPTDAANAAHAAFGAANLADAAFDGTSPASPDFLISARSISDEPDLLDGILGRVIDLVLEGAGAGKGSAEDHRIVLVERHQSHLRRALGAVDRSLEGFRNGLTGDLLVIDLREALDELGKITGQITNEDVLDQIFSKFCIGK